MYTSLRNQGIFIIFIGGDLFLKVKVFGIDLFYILLAVTQKNMGRFYWWCFLYRDTGVVCKYKLQLHINT